MASPLVGTSSDMMENYPLYYKDLYANVSWFRSGANVHIRERLPGGGFTRRGIALTEAEWESLVALAPAVNQALRDLVGAGPDGVWSRAIGDRGRRVEVNRFMGAYYVHVRNYWAQRPGEEPRPTRIGATLSPQAFNRLMDNSVFINEDMRTLHSSQAVRVREDEAFQARLAERRERLRASDAVGTVPDPTGPPPARRWAPLPSSSSSSSSSTLQDPAPSAGPRPRPWFSSVSAPNPGPAPAPSPAATAAAATAAAAAGAEGVAGPSSSEDVSPPSPPTESLAVPIEYELEQYLPGVFTGRNAGDEDVDDDDEDAVIVAVQGPLPPSPSPRRRQDQGKGPRTKKTPKKNRE